MAGNGHWDLWGLLRQGQRLGVTDKVTLATVCLPRVCLMGNEDKSLCEALLAICICAGLLGRLGLFTHQAWERHLVPKFINQHCEPFSRGWRGRLRNYRKCCLKSGHDGNSPVPALCWAFRIFRRPQWEILGGKRNVKHRGR